MTLLVLNEPMPPSRYRDRTWIGIFLLALALLLVFRVFALSINATDLFYDEAQYWFWSENLDFGYYSKPAIIAGVIRAATEVCGHSEFCVRLPSPFIHTATALIIAATGRMLYDWRVGVIAGLIYATLPAVSLSSGLISTDVPLLFFWSVALVAFVWMLQSASWLPVLLFALAFGFGLNAKYAMVWFVVCASLYFIFTPEARAHLRRPHLYVGLVLGLLMLVPNILWNVDHQFATVSHTADNANWQGQLFKPNKAAEFFLAQFGVFGPILFAVLLVITWRGWKEGLSDPDKMLLCFALPVVLAITVQAFLSRAHANWAAVSYVAACILVAAAFVRLASWRWLNASFAIHIAVIVLLAVGTTFAGTMSWPGGRDPFARTLGWELLAQKTNEQILAAEKTGKPFSSIVADKRSHVAQLLYYLRNEPTPVYAWRAKGVRPKDHFQLVMPFQLRKKAGSQSDEPRRTLVVSSIGDASPILKSFDDVEKLQEINLPAGRHKKHFVVFFAVSGYKTGEQRQQ